MSQKCFKRQVMAVIIDKNGNIASGENRISNRAVNQCPRDKGEDYEKCKSICNQEGHAEIMAIKQAKKRGLDLNESFLYLIGHHRICDNCNSECNKENINIVIIGE